MAPRTPPLPLPPLLERPVRCTPCGPRSAPRALSHTPTPPRPGRESAKKKDVRLMNIEAAKAVADAIRTSLGPRGMDKMVGAAGRACNAALG